MERSEDINNKVEEILRRIDVNKDSQEIFIDNVGDDRFIFSFSYDKGIKYIGIKRLLAVKIAEKNRNAVREYLKGFAFQIKEEEPSDDLGISYFTRIDEKFNLGNVIKIMLEAFYPYI